MDLEVDKLNMSKILEREIMVNNDIPKIRSKQFNNTWKSKNLGSLGSVAMNKRIFKEETSETGEIPFYKIGTFGGEPDSFITREKFEDYKSKYPYPEIGDILISASGSIGRTVEYQGEDAYFQDSNIVWLKHDERLDNSFLKQFYSIVKWEGIEGTTIKRLYNKNILETPITLPSPEEQSAIGFLFRTLDDLLAAYKDNLANYQDFKASMLARMFPKTGQIVPEIRLTRFEEEWKKIKLKEIVCEEKKGKAKADMVGTQSVYLDTGYLNGGKKIMVDSPSDISIDDVIILWDGSQAGMIYYGFEGALGTTLKAYTISGNGAFVYYQLKSHQKLIFEKYRTPNIPHVVKTFLAEFEISITSFQEQYVIASLFSNLDSLISSYQEKISQLETLKKKLLQDMFI